MFTTVLWQQPWQLNVLERGKKETLIIKAGHFGVQSRKNRFFAHSHCRWEHGLHRKSTATKRYSRKCCRNDWWVVCLASQSEVTILTNSVLIGRFWLFWRALLFCCWTIWSRTLKSWCRCWSVEKGDRRKGEAEQTANTILVLYRRVLQVWVFRVVFANSGTAWLTLPPKWCEALHGKLPSRSSSGVFKERNQEILKWLCLKIRLRKRR